MIYTFFLSVFLSMSVKSFSLRNSLAMLPPYPSKSPNIHLLLSMMLILSSLTSRYSPWWVLAAYAITGEYDFLECLMTGSGISTYSRGVFNVLLGDSTIDLDGIVLLALLECLLTSMESSCLMELGLWLVGSSPLTGDSDTFFFRSALPY